MFYRIIVSPTAIWNIASYPWLWEPDACHLYENLIIDYFTA